MTVSFGLFAVILVAVLAKISGLLANFLKYWRIERFTGEFLKILAKSGRILAITKSSANTPHKSAARQWDKRLFQAGKTAQKFF